MNYALASEVLDWITEPSGECDRGKLFTLLNQARERMYLLHESLPLFDISYCFQVQTFCVDCNTCAETYRGVTLPRHYQTVEAMWYNDSPIELYSSWREWVRGMSPECSCGLSKFDMPGLFSSERDPIAARPVHLRIVAQSPKDFGKKVTVRAVTVLGHTTTTEYTLVRNGVLTEHAIVALAKGSGFQKPRTEGSVVLAEENGRVLSVYEPDETMPGYKRIKLTGLRNGCEQVNIRGLRRYHPVYREGDVIETNNRTAFEEMVRFLRLNGKRDKNSDDIKGAVYHMAQSKGALMGDKSRELGKSTQTEVNLRSASYGPHRLGGW